MIDVGLMNDIEVNPESLELTVGPGARLFDISRELDRHGLALLSLPSGKGGTLTGWISTGGMGLELSFPLKPGTSLDFQMSEPKLSGSGKGDVLARVHIEVPKRVSKKERELLEQLKQVSG